MPFKLPSWRYYKFTEPEKEVLRTFLDDCWLRLQQFEQGQSRDKFPHLPKQQLNQYKYIRNCFAWLKYQYHLLKLPLPPGHEDA